MPRHAYDRHFDCAVTTLAPILGLGSLLPQAGSKLEGSDSAFVWACRLAADAALHPSATELSPASVSARLTDAVTRLFGPEAPRYFPLLAAQPVNGDSAAALADFARCADGARALRLAETGSDVLAELRARALRRSRDASSGRHYTPAPVADLVVERLMRRVSDGVVYDPALGTGRFLVPLLARRRAGGASAADLIARFEGSELDPVSHSAAQANLLIQLAAAPWHAEPLPLPRLYLENSLQRLGGVGAERFGGCCVNPPYLGERQNRAFFERLAEDVPALGRRRSARGDLMYHFIQLALEQTQFGGVIALLTTAYWFTADGAAALRREMGEGARLVEVINFGEQRLFPSARGQHSLIALFERRNPTESADREEDHLVWARVTRTGPIAAVCESLRHALAAAESCASTAQTDFVVAGRGELRRPGGLSGPWYIPAGRRSEEVLATIAAAGVPLGELALVRQGLISGADKVTPANAPLLGTEACAVIGAWVFVLERDEVEANGLARGCPVLRPFAKNSDIARYAVPPKAPQRFVLYLDGSLPLSTMPDVERHLSRYRPILEARREVRSGAIPWWRLHWPRDEALFVQPRIMCPQRALHCKFAFEDRPLFASADVYFITAPQAPIGWLQLLTGVLNSPTADFWFAHRGKAKGAYREYYSTPLSAMPVPDGACALRANVRALADAAPIDDSLPGRVEWAVMHGDTAAADAAIARATAAMVSLRRKPVPSDLCAIAAGVADEWRMDDLIARLVAIRYGFVGNKAWMYELVQESVAT